MGYGQRWGYSWGNRSLAFVLEDIVVTPKVFLQDASSRLQVSYRDLAVIPKSHVGMLSVLQPIQIGTARSTPSTSLVSIINTALEIL